MEESTHDPDLSDLERIARDSLCGLLLNFAVAVARTHPEPERLLETFKEEASGSTLARSGDDRPSHSARENERLHQMHADVLYRVLERRIGLSS